VRTGNAMNARSVLLTPSRIILYCVLGMLLLLAGVQPAPASPQALAAIMAAADAAMTPPQPFTDDPLTAGLSAIKAVHVSELRARIDTLRARRGLAAFTYTSPSITAGTSVILAADVIEMRTALSQVYTAAGLTPPSYATSPAIGVAIVVADIAGLRSAVVAIE